MQSFLRTRRQQQQQPPSTPFSHTNTTTASKPNLKIDLEGTLPSSQFPDKKPIGTRSGNGALAGLSSRFTKSLSNLPSPRDRDNNKQTFLPTSTAHAFGSSKSSSSSGSDRDDNTLVGSPSSVLSGKTVVGGDTANNSPVQDGKKEGLVVILGGNGDEESLSKIASMIKRSDEYNGEVTGTEGGVEGEDGKVSRDQGNESTGTAAPPISPAIKPTRMKRSGTIKRLLSPFSGNRPSNVDLEGTNQEGQSPTGEGGVGEENAPPASPSRTKGGLFRSRSKSVSSVIARRSRSGSSSNAQPPASSTTSPPPVPRIPLSFSNTSLHATAAGSGLLPPLSGETAIPTTLMTGTANNGPLSLPFLSFNGLPGSNVTSANSSHVEFGTPEGELSELEGGLEGLTGSGIADDKRGSLYDLVLGTADRFASDLLGEGQTPDLFRSDRLGEGGEGEEESGEKREEHPDSEDDYGDASDREEEQEEEKPAEDHKRKSVAQKKWKISLDLGSAGLLGDDDANVNLSTIFNSDDREMPKEGGEESYFASNSSDLDLVAREEQPKLLSPIQLGRPIFDNAQPLDEDDHPAGMGPTDGSGATGQTSPKLVVSPSSTSLDDSLLLDRQQNQAQLIPMPDSRPSQRPRSAVFLSPSHSAPLLSRSRSDDTSLSSTSSPRPHLLPINMLPPRRFSAVFPSDSPDQRYPSSSSSPIPPRSPSTPTSALASINSMGTGVQILFTTTVSKLRPPSSPFPGLLASDSADIPFPRSVHPHSLVCSHPSSTLAARSMVAALQRSRVLRRLSKGRSRITRMEEMELERFILLEKQRLDARAKATPGVSKKPAPTASSSPSSWGKKSVFAAAPLLASLLGGEAVSGGSDAEGTAGSLEKDESSAAFAGRDANNVGMVARWVSRPSFKDRMIVWTTSLHQSRESQAVREGRVKEILSAVGRTSEKGASASPKIVWRSIETVRNLNPAPLAFSSRIKCLASSDSGIVSPRTFRPDQDPDRPARDSRFASSPASDRPPRGERAVSMYSSLPSTSSQTELVRNSRKSMMLQGNHSRPPLGYLPNGGGEAAPTAERKPDSDDEEDEVPLAVIRQRQNQQAQAEEEMRRRAEEAEELRKSKLRAQQLQEEVERLKERERIREEVWKKKEEDRLAEEERRKVREERARWEKVRRRSTMKPATEPPTSPVDSPPVNFSLPSRFKEPTSPPNVRRQSVHNPYSPPAVAYPPSTSAYPWAYSAGAMVPVPVPVLGVPQPMVTPSFAPPMPMGLPTPNFDPRASATFHASPPQLDRRQSTHAQKGQRSNASLKRESARPSLYQMAGFAAQDSAGSLPHSWSDPQMGRPPSIGDKKISAGSAAFLPATPPPMPKQRQSMIAGSSR